MRVRLTVEKNQAQGATDKFVAVVTKPDLLAGRGGVQGGRSVGTAAAALLAELLDEHWSVFGGNSFEVDYRRPVA